LQDDCPTSREGNDPQEEAGCRVAPIAVPKNDWRLSALIVPAPNPHALDLQLAATSPELWLQTGEGPLGSAADLLVAATLVSANPASHSAAQPSPKIVACA
jgi:hypothetical protein